MLVTKQLLAPGTYHSQDAATGQIMPITYTRRDLREFCTNGKAMLAAGLPIPVPLAHDPEAVPPDVSLDEARARRAADLVRNNTGWVRDYSLDADGSWYVHMDIEDEDIVRKLPTTIKYVSPQIHPQFTDGQGRTWRNVCTHVALTTQPVWSGQKPFGDDGAVLMSLSGQSVTPETSFRDYQGGPLRLSLCDVIRFAWTPAKSRKGTTKAVWQNGGTTRKALYGKRAEAALRGRKPKAAKPEAKPKRPKVQPEKPSRAGGPAEDARLVPPRVKPAAQPKPKAAKPQGADTEAQLVDAVRGMTQGRKQLFISDLRKQFPGMDREEFNAKLIQLSRDKRLRIYPATQLWQAGEENREGSIPGVGQPFMYVELYDGAPGEEPARGKAAPKPRPTAKSKTAQAAQAPDAGDAQARLLQTLSEHPEQELTPGQKKAVNKALGQLRRHHGENVKHRIRNLAEADLMHLANGRGDTEKLKARLQGYREMLRQLDGTAAPAAEPQAAAPAPEAAPTPQPAATAQQQSPPSAADDDVDGTTPKHVLDAMEYRNIVEQKLRQKGMRPTDSLVEHEAKKYQLPDDRTYWDVIQAGEQPPATQEAARGESAQDVTKQRPVTAPGEIVPGVKAHDALKSAYAQLLHFPEFQDGLVEFPALFDRMKKLDPAYTPERFHADLESLRKSGAGVEQHILNEVTKAKRPELILRRDGNPYNYLFIRGVESGTEKTADWRDLEQKASRPEPAAQGQPSRPRLEDLATKAKQVRGAERTRTDVLVPGLSADIDEGETETPSERHLKVAHEYAARAKGLWEKSLSPGGVSAAAVDGLLRDLASGDVAELQVISKALGIGKVFQSKKNILSQIRDKLQEADRARESIQV